MYTNRRRLIGMVAVLAAVGSNAHAQTARPLHGTVRDSALGLPLSGAIVQLLDNANQVVSRTLTDQHGQYRLPATDSAVWLQALRIGFRPRNRTLSPGDTLNLIDIVMSRLPQRLEPVVVTANNSCPRRNDAGEAYALWEEVRAGLLATVVARETRPATMRLLEFTREWRFRWEGIDHQIVHAVDAAGTRSFFAVRGAPAFAKLGFMTEDSAGGRAFSGPDADVLLDPYFAATHCLSIAETDKDHPGETGLAFEPVERSGRDTLVEVRGTLWIDPGAAALRTLEFQYANLEPAAARAGVGGKVSFLSLENGVTLISDWSIRYPILDHAYTNGLWGGLHLRRSKNNYAHVLSLFEAGGQLVSAVWPDSTSWHARLPTVVGVVVDSVGRPLPGVAVGTDSTDYHAVSDAKGGFVIHDVIPGPYHWFATVGGLGRLGVHTGPEEDLDVEPRDSLARVRLEAHLGEDGRDFFCGRKQRSGTVAFVGVLLNADHTPGANLDVHVVWGGDTGANKIDVVSDDDGRFEMCGVPVQPPQLLMGTVSAARIMVFKGETRVVNARLEFPSKDWIQAITITLPAVSP